MILAIQGETLALLVVLGGCSSSLIFPRFTITAITAEGRLSSYRVVTDSDGTKHQTNTSSCGCPIQATLSTDESRDISYSDGTSVSIQTTPDPRWGERLYLPQSTTITTGGLTSSITTNRSVTLSNPSDPLSLSSQTDTVTINGRIFTSTYDASTRTAIDTTPENRQMTTTLNAQGEVSTVQIPALVPITYTYDDNGRIATIAQGASRVYTFTYDESGNLDTVTDPLSRTMSFDYDLAGRMTKQVLPDLREIDVTYDPDGNVTTIQPPGRPVHTFSYTPINLEEQYTPPDIGIGPPQTTYTYNLDRQLTQVLRPDGKTIGLSYNATTGFLDTITIPRGQISLTYQPGTGYVQSMTAPGNETLTFTYNQSLQTGTTFSGTINGSITRTYDNDFRITSQSINGGNTITYQYDNDGLLTQAGDLMIARDPQNGLITGTTLGNVTDTIDYTDLIDGNNFGEVAHYHAQFATDPLFDVTYERDSLGRITKKTETIDGESHIFEYAYYPAGWLHQVKKDGEDISTYTYDSKGNRLNHTTHPQEQ